MTQGEKIELPEPYARMPRCVPYPESPECSNAVLLTSVDVYTAEQVRAAVLAERERCAKVCDAEAVKEENDNGAASTGGAAACAAAIRSGT